MNMSEYILLITHDDGHESWVRGNELAVTESIRSIKETEPRAQMHAFLARELPFEIKMIQRTVCTLKH